MRKTRGFDLLAAVVALAVAAGFAGPAAAQSSSGKIVCWKDKSGKTVGCGDKVPPEYQTSATRELDSRGVTRRQTESVEEANARRQREQDAARAKSEDDRKKLDQQRQDTALLETFSNEKEIDLKRDRDLSVIDGQIEQLSAALKPVAQRYSESKARFDAAEKAGKGTPPATKDEYQRAMHEKERLERSIANKQIEKEDLRKRYAEYKRRYTELKTGGQPATTTSAAAKK
jgi:hypothetical protein